MVETKDLQGPDASIEDLPSRSRARGVQAKADVTVPYQATSLTTIVQMVANGIGTTLLLKMATDAGIAEGTNLVLRPFDEPYRASNWVDVAKKNAPEA